MSFFRRTLSLVASLFLFVAASPASAVSPTIVVSQVYGGGGNAGATYKNDFIELFNRGASTVSVAGWSVQYSSATGTTWQVTNLLGSIPPGGYYLVQEAVGAGGTTNLPTPDATGTIALSATAGKVVLVNTTTALSGACPSGASLVDVVGFGATANCFEGGGPTPAPSNTTAVLRASNGCTDTDVNSSDFTAGAPTPRNSGSPASSCAGSTNPSGVGTASPASVPASGTTLLTVAVTAGTSPASTGLAVTTDLTPIGGVSNQVFFDDGSHGDVTPGDLIFSFSATVAPATTPGPKSLGVTITDLQARTGTTSIALTVQSPLLAVHTIQGSGSTSPFVGQLVTTHGIVTGVKTNGFFIQTPDAQVDADPNTSEGVFVFTSSAPPAAAVVGNDVTVSGTVAEFIPTSDPGSPPTTEIAGSVSVSVVSSGNPLPAAILLTAADTSPTGSIEQLEKYEGMRVTLGIGTLTVSGPTQGTINEPNATSTSNGVFYGVITGVARPFREPGVEVPDPLPAGSPCCVPRFDANPERLRVDSDAIGSPALEVTAGAVVSNLTGPLDYGFRTYTIDPEPASPPSIAGNVSATPVPVPAADEVTIGSFNMERFFDTVDDPSTSDAVLTAAAFNNRLNKASLAIRNVMRSPDVIGVEEMENLTTLQAVAARVNADTVTAGGSDPGYQAFLVEGNDIGGIDVGFLVKASRVTVVDVTQFGKTTTYIDPSTGNPALLNDRPPLLLRATVAAPPGPPFAFTVIVNHLRSLSGIDDPTDGNRVRTKRRAQAEYLANLIQGRQVADSAERIISVGDYNAFQVSDGYVDTIGTIKGTPAPSTEVVLASPDLVNPDLSDLVDTLPAAQRYSYNFDGNAQVLDHILVNSTTLPSVRRFAYARNDADFPESFRNDSNRPERISDHDMPVVYLALSATASVSGGGVICAGASATIRADLTGTPPWSLTWSDGVSQTGLLTSPATRSVSPSMTTTYTVTAVSDAGGPGSASGSALVTVNGAPATPVITAPSVVGAGSPNRKASVPATAGSSYAWLIGNGTITAGQGTSQVTFTAGVAGTSLTLSVVETNSAGCSSPAGSAVVPVAPAGNAVLFYTVTPCRVVDTRSTPPALAPIGSPDRTFTLTGACGIPAGATSVAANMTVVGPQAPGHLVVYPGNGPLPGTSYDNFVPGRSRANTAILLLSSDGTGTVKVRNGSTAPVDFVLDVSGYFQ